MRRKGANVCSGALELKSQEAELVAVVMWQCNDQLSALPCKALQLADKQADLVGRPRDSAGEA